MQSKQSKGGTLTAMAVVFLSLLAGVSVVLVPRDGVVPRQTGWSTSQQERKTMATLVTTFCYLVGEAKVSLAVTTTKRDDETHAQHAARHDAAVTAAMAGKQVVDC